MPKYRVEEQEGTKDEGKKSVGDPGCQSACKTNDSKDDFEDDNELTAQLAAKEEATTSKLSRFEELSEDLAELLVGPFESEEDLEKTLKRIKLSDLPILLGEDGQAYFHIPGDRHCGAARWIVAEVNYWGARNKGIACQNFNIWLGPQRPAGGPPPRKRQKRSKRLPDVSIWGASRCSVSKNDGLNGGPKPASSKHKFPRAHPHVVIQLNMMFDDEDYEIDAIDDIMNRADAAQGPPPNLGVLIQCRAAEPGVQAGFDMYTIPQGRYFRDAVRQTGGATHMVYNKGGPDVTLEITEAHLGGFSNNHGVWETISNLFRRKNGNFQLSLEELYRIIE